MNKQSTLCDHLYSRSQNCTLWLPAPLLTKLKMSTLPDFCRPKLLKLILMSILSSSHYPRFRKYNFHYCWAENEHPPCFLLPQVAKNNSDECPLWRPLPKHTDYERVPWRWNAAAWMSRGGYMTMQSTAARMNISLQSMYWVKSWLQVSQHIHTWRSISSISFKNNN